MSEIRSPHKIAEDILKSAGFSLIAPTNDQGGIKRQQLKVLSLFPAVVRKNAYKTINRLKKSADKQNIDFAANVKNTVTGTIQSAYMDNLERLTADQKRKIIIKWIPSSAKVSDPVHSLYYGQIMTLERALALGLGTRYGCQCGFRIISGAEILKEAEAQFLKGVKK